jgi:DNA-binding winged helix-turn-helix (wHTH) protein/TolB-like protein/Tfp pilus assembly protein PilF
MRPLNLEFVEFGPFRLNRAEGVLFLHNTMVPMPPKSIEILTVLVENQGRVVSKEMMLERIWPDVFVEESNLTKNLSLLRKLLSEHDPQEKYIETVPKRGYRFVAPVREIDLLSPQNIVRTGWVDETGRRKGWVVLAAAILLLALTTLSGWYYLGARSHAGRIRSIAVLPFINSGDTANDYLADGLTETLITDISHLPGLLVKAKTAVFRYKGSPPDAAKAGKELSADAVLVSRLGQTGNDLRVEMELIETTTQNVLWSRRFSKSSDDALGLRQDIYASVAERLSTSDVRTEMAATSPGAYSENREAYTAYLTGKYLQNQRTRESMPRAHENFKRAVELDPHFAAAWVSLSETYNYLAAAIKVIDERTAAQEYRTAIRKALELDPNLAEAHAANGWLILNEDWDFAGARREFQNAVELNPNSARAHYRYSWLLYMEGQLEQAITESRTAEELDPLDSINLTVLGGWLVTAGRYEEAFVPLRKSMDLAPDNAGNLEWMALLFAKKADYDTSLGYLESAISVSDRPSLIAERACLKAKKGDIPNAQRALKELLDRRDTRRDVTDLDLAQLYAALGDNDKAFASLEEAYAKRTYDIKFLRYYPFLEPLHDDPRFMEMVNRIYRTRPQRTE